MTEEEKKYQEEMRAAGVELPEFNNDGSADKAKAEAEAKAKEEADEKARAEKEAADAKAKAEAGDDDTPPPPPRSEKKRSIYDDLKDKKDDLKNERELRQKAEQERDRLMAEREALLNGDGTLKNKVEVKDDLKAYAEEYGLDPEAIAKMQDLFLKGVKPSIDPELQKNLNRFMEWEKDNSSNIEKAQFEKEYKSTLPTINKLFPNAKPEELESMKAKLEEIAHSKGWEDKELDYIVFKHEDVLSKLTSPKKRGLETKGNNDGGEEIPTDFNPNADYSKMSPKQREVWETEYNKLTSRSEGLSTDSQGRKIII
jgi:hypothetical protein